MHIDIHTCHALYLRTLPLLSIPIRTNALPKQVRSAPRHCLRVFVDVSVVEAHLDRKVSVTNRHFPARPERGLGLFVYATGGGGGGRVSGVISGSGDRPDAVGSPLKIQSIEIWGMSSTYIR